MDTHVQVCRHISINITFTPTTHNMLRTRIKREMELSSITVQEEQNQKAAASLEKTRWVALTFPG